MVQLSCCLPPTCSGSDVARYTAATRAHRDVASAYGVALWHFEDHLDGACDERAYDLVGHPRWPTHALVAEALFASWGAMQARIEDLDGRHAAVRGGAAAGYAARGLRQGTYNCSLLIVLVLAKARLVALAWLRAHQAPITAPPSSMIAQGTASRCVRRRARRVRCTHGMGALQRILELVERLARRAFAAVTTCEKRPRRRRRW